MRETDGNGLAARSRSELLWRKPVLRRVAGHAAGRGTAWRGCCARLPLLSLLSLLALGAWWLWWLMTPALQPAHAGEARASFQVGIRIGPLATSDAASASARAVTVATSSATDGNASGATTSASGPAATATPRTALRRVGGGWCVRVTLSDGRWRWQCD